MFHKVVPYESEDAVRSLWRVVTGPEGRGMAPACGVRLDVSGQIFAVAVATGAWSRNAGDARSCGSDATPMVSISAACELSRADTTVLAGAGQRRHPFECDELAIVVLVVLDDPHIAKRAMPDAGVDSDRVAVAGIAARMCIGRNIES